MRELFVKLDLLIDLDLTYLLIQISKARLYRVDLSRLSSSRRLHALVRFQFALINEVSEKLVEVFILSIFLGIGSPLQRIIARGDH